MLLPSGFTDILAPQAGSAATATQTLLGAFADYSYERVAPPLMEFEETLLNGAGTAQAHSTFRVMDPISQRMLGLRTDHTLQVGRIASSRLADAPRPLRLSYAGSALRVQAAENSIMRQVEQVGVELIGSLAPEADAETIQLALYGLQKLGLDDVTVDLLLPTLIPALCEAENMDGATQRRLHHALDRKDEAGVIALMQDNKSKAAEHALQLLRASGAAEKALSVLNAMDLPDKAQADRNRLNKVLALYQPPRFTVDLVEYRGFEYQTGLSFALFSNRTRAEMARGGRYRTGHNEPATGFTFYMENLDALITPPAARPVKDISFAMSAAEKNQLIAQGFAVKYKI